MYMADHPPSPLKNLLFLLSSTEVKLIMISTFEHLIQPSQCNLQPRLKMVKRLVFFFYYSKHVYGWKDSGPKDVILLL